MKIGYPCINRSIDCQGNSTFRLASYSEERLIKTVKNNLDCLAKILRYNVVNELLFFRITSDLIPFASHPVCEFDWVNYFEPQFKEIGSYIQENNIRTSMHPDQFVLINSLRKDVVRRSIDELEYHCKIFNAMGLDETAKIQFHVGGVYGDKPKAIERFIENYDLLDKGIKKRLVIENDERSYTLKDCLLIHQRIKIPIVFDSFHHECNNNGESIKDALIQAQRTWQEKDGLLIVHYSSQREGKRKGSHALTIDLSAFTKFIRAVDGVDFDIMLEIKDKEKSALKAVEVLRDLKKL